MGIDVAGSPRKRAVRSIVERTKEPFTAQQIWERCKETHPGISRATVYRQLRKLRHEGFIRDIVLPHGLHVSVRAITESFCLVECERCGRFQLKPGFASKVLEAAAGSMRTPSHMAIYIRSKCGECTRRKPHEPVSGGRIRNTAEGRPLVNMLSP